MKDSVTDCSVEKFRCSGLRGACRCATPSVLGRRRLPACGTFPSGCAFGDFLADPRLRRGCPPRCLALRARSPQAALSAASAAGGWGPCGASAPQDFLGSGDGAASVPGCASPAKPSFIYGVRKPLVRDRTVTDFEATVLLDESRAICRRVVRTISPAILVARAFDSGRVRIVEPTPGHVALRDGNSPGRHTPCGSRKQQPHLYRLETRPHAFRLCSRLAVRPLSDEATACGRTSVAVPCTVCLCGLRRHRSSPRAASRSAASGVPLPAARSPAARADWRC